MLEDWNCIKNTFEKECIMRNSNTRTSTTKIKLPKCKNIFYAYNDLQLKYGELLSKRNDVQEFKANVKLDGFSLGDSYTTDFVIITNDGKTVIRECVYKDKILKPLTIKLLDASREYWIARGFKDWGIVVNA